ncbi:MAG TPA: hypothetical protein H9898_00975 [Candidatus Anaerobiospirillum stercoravium]|nr:hypothetical protein [Candidatus Anaerobiospirillum stercoravium]
MTTMEQTKKNLQSLYRLSPSDSYLDEPNGRTLGAQVSAQAAAQLGQLALSSARQDKFSSLNFAQNWNIPGFDPCESSTSDELSALSAAALEAYAYSEDYDFSPEDYQSLMRVRHYVKTQDEARAQTLGMPQVSADVGDDKPRYVIYRSGAVMPLRPAANEERGRTQRQKMSYGMSQGMARSVGLEQNLATERYSQYVNLPPTNNATTRITMSISSRRAQDLAAAHPEGLMIDATDTLRIKPEPSAPSLPYEVTEVSAESCARLSPEQEIIATVVADEAAAHPATSAAVSAAVAPAADAAAPEAAAPNPAEVTPMPTDAPAQPSVAPQPSAASQPSAAPQSRGSQSAPPRDELIAASEGVRIVRSNQQAFVPSTDSIIAQHSLTRERWGEYGLKGGNGRPLNSPYPQREDDFFTPPYGRPLTVAEAQAALDAAKRRQAQAQAYGVGDETEVGDHIANEVLVRNNTTCIVTSSRKAALEYQKSAALEEELERVKKEQAPERDEGPATVISRHAVMQRPVKSAAQLLAEAQAQIIAPISATPDAGWENAIGRSYVNATPSVESVLRPEGYELEPQAEPQVAPVEPQVEAYVESLDAVQTQVELQAAPQVIAPDIVPAAEPEVAVESEPELAVAPQAPTEPSLEPFASEVVAAPEAPQASEVKAARPEVARESVAPEPTPSAELEAESAAESVGPEVAAVEPEHEPVPEHKPEPMVAAPAAVVAVEPVVAEPVAAEVPVASEVPSAPVVAPVEAVTGRRSRRTKTRFRAKVAAAAALAELNAAELNAAKSQVEAAIASETKAESAPVKAAAVKSEPVAVAPQVESPASAPLKAESAPLDVASAATQAAPSAEVAPQDKLKTAPESPAEVEGAGRRRKRRRR